MELVGLVAMVKEECGWDGERCELFIGHAERRLVPIRLKMLPGTHLTLWSEVDRHGLALDGVGPPADGRACPIGRRGKNLGVFAA